jgi:alpha-glucosidase
LFRRAAALRTRLATSDVRAAELAWSLGEEGRLMAVRSDGIRIVIAMGEVPVELPVGVVLLSSEPLVNGLLPVDAAAWVGPESQPANEELNSPL